MTFTKTAMLTALCAFLIPMGAQAADATVQAQAAKAGNDNKVAASVVTPEKTKDSTTKHKTHMHHAKHVKAVEAVKAPTAAAGTEAGNQ